MVSQRRTVSVVLSRCGPRFLLLAAHSDRLSPAAAGLFLCRALCTLDMMPTRMVPVDG
jgi:hypothetical protein